MKQIMMIAATFGVIVTAAAGAAKNPAARKSHARHALHQRARKQYHRKLYHRKVTTGGAHREGPIQVRPDGTVIPNGLKPSIVPVPEILKKKGSPQG